MKKKYGRKIFIRFSNDGDVHICSENEVNKLLTGAGFHTISWELITNHAYLSTCKKRFEKQTIKRNL